MQGSMARRQWGSFRLSTVIALLVVGPMACGDTGDGGAGDTNPGGDLSDPDTTTGADLADGLTPGPSRCLLAEDCDEAGAVCSCEGLCVVPTGVACEEDRNCGVPRWCNTCTGHCEEQAPLCGECTESRGCRDQGACLPFASGGSYCGLGCITDVGCPRGYRCADVDGLSVRQCVPLSGLCGDLDLCTADEECPVGRICISQTGQCAAGCVDGGCPVGEVCQAGRCRPACGSNEDCVAPAECEQSGRCRVPGTCEEREHCPEPETYCDRTSGLCADGCLEDIDCQDAGKVCTNRRCVPKGCTHNYQCAFGQVCEQASGNCVPFPASEPHCGACDAQQQDDPACPAPNLCATFQDDEGQSQGDYCLVSCQDDPVDGCPSGWQCQRFDDDGGGAPRFLCTRPCNITPVGL